MKTSQTWFNRLEEGLTLPVHRYLLLCPNVTIAMQQGLPTPHF